MAGLGPAGLPADKASGKVGRVAADDVKAPRIGVLFPVHGAQVGAQRGDVRAGAVTGKGARLLQPFL